MDSNHGACVEPSVTGKDRTSFDVRIPCLSLPCKKRPSYLAVGIGVYCHGMLVAHLLVRWNWNCISLEGDICVVGCTSGNFKPLSIHCDILENRIDITKSGSDIHFEHVGSSHLVLTQGLDVIRERNCHNFKSLLLISTLLTSIFSHYQLDVSTIPDISKHVCPHSSYTVSHTVSMDDISCLSKYLYLG